MDFYRFPPHATDDLFLELAVPETSYRHSPRGVRAENKFALEGRIVIGSDSHHENNNEKKKKRCHNVECSTRETDPRMLNPIPCRIDSFRVLSNSTLVNVNSLIVGFNAFLLLGSALDCVIGDCI